MLPCTLIRNMDDWWKEYERALWALKELSVRRKIWKKHLFWLQCVRHRLIGYNETTPWQTKEKA